LRLSIASLLAALATLMFAPAVDARITKIQITTKESPTFGGYSWPGVGQYEKIVGKAFGEVDPTDPKNSVIVDILLAPRNSKGRVEYSFDFYILKPIDLTKGASKVMYEPPNRGRKTWPAFGRVSTGGNDPRSITDATELANSAGTRHHPNLHGSRVTTGASPQRLSEPGLQSSRERQEGVRRHDAVDRGQRRHQHELQVLAAGPHGAQSPGSPVCRRRVPVRQRVDD
jgi:hypothetical protein